MEILIFQFRKIFFRNFGIFLEIFRISKFRKNKTKTIAHLTWWFLPVLWSGQSKSTYQIEDKQELKFYLLYVYKLQFTQDQARFKIYSSIVFN